MCYCSGYACIIAAAMLDSLVLQYCPRSLMHVLLHHLCMCYCSGSAAMLDYLVLQYCPGSLMHVLLQRVCMCYCSGYARVSGTAKLSEKPVLEGFFSGRLLSEKACQWLRQYLRMRCTAAARASRRASKAATAPRRGPTATHGTWSGRTRPTPPAAGPPRVEACMLRVVAAYLTGREVNRQGERVISDPLRVPQRFFWPFDAAP
jgi:hypothetical protein